MAASLNADEDDCTNVTSPIVPSAWMTASSTTVPFTPAASMMGGYTGSTFLISVTCPGFSRTGPLACGAFDALGCSAADAVSIDVGFGSTACGAGARLIAFRGVVFGAPLVAVGAGAMLTYALIGPTWVIVTGTGALRGCHTRSASRIA